MADVAKKNLLAVEELDVLDRLGWLYIVANGLDYRMSITTLIAGLNKNDVGLSNVNNTADADKPISTATQQAIDAITQTIQNNLATKSELNNVITQLQDYVKTQDYQTKINEIEERLNGVESVTPEVVNQLIAAALTPINDQLNTILQQNFITQATFNLQIAQLRDELTQEINSGINTALNTALSTININLTALNQFATDTQAEIEGIKEVLQTQDAAVSELSSRVDTYDQRITDAETQVTEAAQVAASVGGRVTSLEERVEVLEAESIREGQHEW